MWLLALCATAAALAQTITLEDVHAFERNRGGPDGFGPEDLMATQDNVLYGTTGFGGAFDGGTVFRIGLDGVYAVLHAFRGIDGVYPYGCLIEGSDGQVYGAVGRNSQYSSIFQLTASGSLKTVYEFPILDAAGITEKMTVSVAGRDGNVYYLSYPYGVLDDADFQLLASRAIEPLSGPVLQAAATERFMREPWPITVVKSGLPISVVTLPSRSEAAAPYCGTTVAAADGHIWRLEPLTERRSLTSDSRDGSYVVWRSGAGPPFSASAQSLIAIRGRPALSEDGVGLYAVVSTDLGNDRTFDIESMGPDELLKPVASLQGPPEPVFGLLRARDGYYYGLLQAKGRDSGNGVYRFRAGKPLKVFYPFIGVNRQARLATPLVQGPDGLLYGMTFDGEENRSGSIYRLKIVP
jgi:uncharacterized repeat protein (TIGR03803 family)